MKKKKSQVNLPILEREGETSLSYNLSLVVYLLIGCCEYARDFEFVFDLHVHVFEIIEPM